MKENFNLRLFLCVSISIIGFACANPSPAAGLVRVPNTTLRMPLTADNSEYMTVPAFRDVPFIDPMVVVSPPVPAGHETHTHGEELFVVEEGGAILVITDLEAPDRTVFLDMSDHIAYASPSEEGGLLGLAFHPGYETNGYFFVYYLCNTVTANGSGRHDRLSRFTRSATDEHKADRSSELILFSQYDEKFNHNGGTVMFGPDGYLYLTLGDEGHPNDMFDNAQRIDKDFFSGVIRIDVDHRPGNLPPNDHSALNGQTNYWIPADNPYVGATTFNGRAVDPVRVRTEFWAVGLRSPWRMFIDHPTGDIFVGDVGEEAGEELNLIVRGGNYGWPYLLGNAPGPKADQAPPGFKSIPPLLTYERGNVGAFVGRCIVGGVVYRGARMPELNGAYIFGDFYNGNIWALRHNGNTVTEWKRLAYDGDIVSFGIDPRNGDVLLCDIGEDTVRRLVHTPGSDRLPATLADTGAFADLRTLTPNPGIVPYDVNVQFPPGDSLKTHWLSVPGDKRIGFNAARAWALPAGTVFIKQVDLEMVKGDPPSRRRFETRFFVKTEDSGYGAIYRWNETQDNAFLVPEDGAEELITIVENGVARQKMWHFGSRLECMGCHTSVSGFAPGMNTQQINRSFDWGRGPENQLQAMAKAGFFSNAVPLARTLPALVAIDSKRAPIEQRVRSYLDAHCSHCHQPGGPALALWDARITTPLVQSGIVGGAVRNPMGDPLSRVVMPRSLERSVLYQHISSTAEDVRMPPAEGVQDQQAIALVQQWIESLPNRRNPLKVRITSAPARTTESAVAVRGVASGANLARVIVTVNGGPEQVANGISNWTIQCELSPGINKILARAEDNDGIRSRPFQRLMRYTPSH